MSRLLVGHIPAEYLPPDCLDGLDIKLEISDEGQHYVAVRPGRGERWVTWGAPHELIAQSAEVE